MYHRTNTPQQALGIWGAAVNVIEEGWDFITAGERAKGEAAAHKAIAEQLAKQQQQRQQTPSWVLPVAIGGGVLVLALVMTGGRRRQGS